MSGRIDVLYHVRSDARSIDGRAKAIAIEQSVEMPVEPIDDPFVLEETVGRVEAIDDLGGGLFAVRIGLAAITTGMRPGQLLNMLFGNTSLQDDTVLVDATFPAGFAEAFKGPRHGLEGLRARVGATGALSCSALKPQGSSPRALATIAARMAQGGIDYIKDDHGIADQSYSPFAERVPVIADAVATEAAKTGVPTRYFPSLSGNLDDMRGQIALARSCGLDGVLIAPMLVGVDQFLTLKAENPDLAFLGHPTLGGLRITQSFLLGKLFRLLGADATIFPNYGGRFGNSKELCLALADGARRPWMDLKPCMPVPAGGMTLDRVPEMLEFYGSEVMLLIGGSLLSTKERLPQETARYVNAVRSFGKR
ncbi:MAG TPA: RuBisCO large subunit C-terminal-like domain-containing protein [Rhizomicrobium sp.]|nr:RuBisCO large subunit C-terminal-like domain-containing protein [Rhizomicrobium sp.]